MAWIPAGVYPVQRIRGRNDIGIALYMESGQNYWRGPDMVVFLKNWMKKDAAVVYLM